MLGAAALCVGMFGVAGCSNQVMAQREFVPMDQGMTGGYQDGQVTPMPQVSQSVPQQNVPQQPAAPVQQRPSVPQYVPMEKLSSSPVSEVPVQGSTGAVSTAKGGTTHVIKAGDIVSVDVGAYLNGYHGDNAATFAAGKVSPEAQALMDGTADTLSGLTVTDDTHFTIKLDHPYAGFLGQLATPCAVILSRSITEAAGDSFGQDPAVTIGSGPYVVSEWNRNQSLILEANPNYWGEQPEATRIEILIVPDVSNMSMMFKNGELDVLDGDELDSAEFDSTNKTGQYDDKLVSAPRLSTTYMALNANIEPLNDVRVRKAIQMAIDRESILNTVYSGGGNLLDGIFSPGLIGYNEDNQGWLQYDPEGAKALLEEAGYGGGFTLEISSDNSAASGTLLVLQIIQQNLAEVGITVEIMPYDEASWLDLRRSGEMPSFVATWTADYNDPDNFIYTFFGTEENTVQRSLNYADKDVIARVAAARSIVDEDERLAEYAALEKKIVEEDAAWVPLFSRTHNYVMGDRVASFTPHWAGYSAFIFSTFELAE